MDAALVGDGDEMLDAGDVGAAFGEKALDLDRLEAPGLHVDDVDLAG